MRIAVIVIMGLILLTSIVMNHVHERDNAAAQRDGFIDARDKARANSRGFSDPEAWKTTTAAELEAARIRKEEETAARTISRPAVEFIGWSKGALGTVGIVTLRITNTSKLGSISDVRVLCEFFGGSNTPINSRLVTIYETLKPSKSITKKLNVGFIDQQANRASCRFDGAEVPTGMIIGY